MTFNPILPETSGKPIIIAGPCSAESKEQVMTTAQALAKYPEVTFFRASVWKPRTQPGAFEGVGILGLDWLKEVKAITGLRTCIEVAGAAHVEQALAAGIDAVWIGARTTVNPFLIEEIAKALKGTDIPVMVKNPVNPDIDLWIGTIERFYRNDITRLAAIHRGFSGFHKGIYRNEPFWEMIFELRRRLPQLPIINDPSHLTGDSRLVPALCQKALDLEADGLMIEVHPCPEKALTDKNQQLTFEEFARLMQTLVYRKYNDDNIHTEILQLRTQIDEIDIELIKLLAHRMGLVKNIGNIKRQNQLTILQMDRWKDVVASRLNYGQMQGLDKEFLLKILQTIHEESVKVQSDIFEQKG